MKIKIPNKENHYALWNWLANHPDKWQKEWPGFKTLKRLRNKIVSHCFACAENEKLNGFKSYNCTDKCPLYLTEACKEDLNDWHDAYGVKYERERLAKIIRDAWERE